MGLFFKKLYVIIFTCCLGNEANNHHGNMVIVGLFCA